MLGQSRKLAETMPLVIPATLLVVSVLAVAGGTAFAGLGYGSPVREKARLNLSSTGIIPAATGEAEMELSIAEGQMKLRARARAEGLPDEAFSLCIDNAFKDGGTAQGGKVDLGLEVDFQTLSGLEVTIREGAGCDGDVVLEGTVEDLAS